MKRHIQVFAVLLCAAVLAACTPAREKLPPLALPEGCQPLLGGSDCFGPFPSDFFRTEDASLPSGHRLQLTRVARIRSDSGLADPLSWRPVDGASLAPTLVTSFPGGLLPNGFPAALGESADSVADGAQTLWVEAGTGRKIHHFVDLDPRAKTPERQALVFHVREGLEENTRYVVAIRRARAPGGGLAPAPEGFRRIRDGEAAGDPQLEPLAQRFEREIFPVLAAAGWTRSEVQLAWDFTTGTRENVTRDMLRVRALTLEWLGSHVPSVSVDSVTENADAKLWRTVKGTVEAPLFLEQDAPGANLYRGPDGQVAQNGTTQFKFIAQVPVSVRDGAGEANPLLYGHGFFGSEDEVTYSPAVTLANRLGVVTFGIRWVGMAGEDAPIVGGNILGDPTATLQFTERVHQAMANWMVMSRAVEGPLRAQAAFARPGGAPVYAADASRYLGCSQGHILGGVMNALNPSMRRVILNVGGASFSTMMMRARPFNGFLLLIEGSIRDPLDQQKFIATLQASFDRVDPASYAPWLVSHPLEGSPADRRVLMQVGLGDTSVPNVGSFLHAQLAGLTQLLPAPARAPLLPASDGPLSGSALALYDFGVDLAAVYGKAEPAPVETDAHEGLRRKEAAMAQMDLFLREGTIRNFCDGACDPE
jgi:hypothetical protein